MPYTPGKNSIHKIYFFYSQKIYFYYKEILNDKIQNLLTALQDFKEGAENDVKSSAGDKHETARAMMQLEIEKTNRQLNEFQKQMNDLEKIDVTASSSKIINGSLIKANNIYFFLSVAIGKIDVEGINVMVLSSQSPLGLKMSGHKKDDSVELNGTHYLIEEVE